MVIWLSTSDAVFKWDRSSFHLKMIHRVKPEGEAWDPSPKAAPISDHPSALLYKSEVIDRFPHRHQIRADKGKE